MVARDHTTSDRWQEALSRIPSLFGRLVYISSLRDQDTGCYNYGNGSGNSVTEDVLRTCHGKVFADWLCLGLQLQMADLERYLSGLETEMPAVVNAWERQMPYQYLLPETASEAERRLFFRDLELMLKLAQKESGGA